MEVHNEIILQMDNDKSDNETGNAKEKRKRGFWTEEKIDTAKRLCENGFKPKEIAIATGMSLRAAQQFYADTFPSEDGGQWGEFIVRKRGPKVKDNSLIRNKIIEMLREDRTLTYQQIADRMPYDMKRSKYVIAAEIKKIKGLKRKVNNNNKRNKEKKNK